MRCNEQTYWIFSPSIDISAFLGSAIFSFFLLALGWKYGYLNGDSPEWTWIGAVLLIDVAHVWATSFRVYFDREEFERRVVLYTLVPVLGYVFGVFLYSEGELTFWRVLAAIAVFHFVRQQFGWVSIYRAKCDESSNLTWWIDAAAIYSASIYPLIFWMSSSKRNFNWFLEGDFVSIPAVIEKIAFPLYLLVLAAYFAKTIYQYSRDRFINPGKDIVVATTAICWYVGIVAFNSDYAFTVTNILIHGIPYFVLLYFYARVRRKDAGYIYRSITSNWLVFFATLWALAYIEEFFWDKAIWHERANLFGNYWEVGEWKMFFVPLLALPQISHYVLDGFIWRRKYNENFRLSDLQQ